MIQRHGTKYFNETLAHGIEFEQGQALEILHQTFPTSYIINNQIDPIETTDGKVVGPRLYKGENREEELIAPDFTIFDIDGQPMWVDAKLKKSAYSYKGRKYFSVDQKKHKSYAKFPDWMRQYFYFLFKSEETNGAYLARFQDNPTTIFFNNQYDTGDIPAYFLEDIIDLGIFEDK